MRLRDLLSTSRQRLASARVDDPLRPLRDEDDELAPAAAFPRAEDTVPWSAQVAGAWALRFLLIVAALWVILNLLNAVSLVVITVTIAMMINALLGPIVSWLVAHGVPRPVGALVVFIGGCGVIVGGLWFVVVQTSGSWEDLGTQVAQGIDTIQRWFIEGPFKATQAQVDQVGTDIIQQINNNKGVLAGSAWQAANSAIGVLSGAALCMFALLFMLFDDGQIANWVASLAPSAAIKRVRVALRIAWTTLVAYMRSTVILAVINSLTMVVIMMIAGMPLIAPMAVLLFIGSLIPLIGMIVAGLVVCLVALVTKGFVTAIVLLVALFLTVQLEGNLLNPYILGRAVSLHPLGILVTVTAGTMVGGIYGAFIAVPLVAVINNVAKELRHRPIVLPAVVPAVAEPAPGEPDVPRPPVARPRDLDD